MRAGFFQDTRYTSMDRKKYRIAVLNSHPIQYFAPLYRFLCRDADLEVTALYCSDSSLRGGIDPGFGQAVSWDVDLLSGYPSVFLGGERARKRTPRGFFSLICPEVWAELRDGGYDAVLIHGYSFAAYVLGMLAARVHGIPVFIRSETHLGLSRAPLRQRMRDFILARVYRSFAAFLAIGTENRNYYLSLGVPEHKIFAVPYTVDNDRIIEAARRARQGRVGLRRELGVPEGSCVVLYASKFMRRKHPDDVIAAVAKLQKEGADVSLLMVGTGEMEAELRTQAASLDVKNIAFTGFVNQSRLPSLYAASDVFVLPSEDEPWGLVVNEVMCAGLPVVVAAGVGCVADLVEDGINGAVSKPGDVESLASALRRVLRNDELRRAMGEASLSRIRNWSYTECKHGLLSALEAVAARR